MTYDSKGDTLEHIHKVGSFIGEIICALTRRARYHDASKLLPPEKEHFDRMTPLLAGVTYGTNEYREMLKALRPAIEHHNEFNSHHPEHYPDGIDGMDLVDLVEMICDWKAASLRHDDGDIMRSLKINAERFEISPQLARILENTIKHMGWHQ